MNMQPRIEDIPSGIIDVDLETDRFEQWYCWVRNFNLVEWRKEQAELKADNRKDSVVHHCRCTWLNAKRDMVNQRAAFMKAHSELVEACEELTDPRVIINAPQKSHDALDKMEEAIAMVKEAS